ncbi:hypothetical protein SPRG_07203 [Saprolegnia parasitica CBS 223.65]|uniref:Uncharacterized protein n=1 Tax=Saprolegnia parasitica (strain CBS 223.65) TaxID=695850 RepID=A0A067CAX8_SAPPC|nr:hypothetical protein SPRG_07203 [Saprolegnia parasitica CBS 223.65]KDO27929.1 hypothetical protein SPRG_07203 [Saprolegnia parasitica CBS 223.65]|eukprot:XP_012201385.1 hypothetical protein SPRG_07203 [Saprolegnia parasitica CBS 223.65]
MHRCLLGVVLLTLLGHRNVFSFDALQASALKNLRREENDTQRHHARCGNGCCLGQLCHLQVAQALGPCVTGFVDVGVVMVVVVMVVMMVMVVMTTMVVVTMVAVAGVAAVVPMRRLRGNVLVHAVFIIRFVFVRVAMMVRTAVTTVVTIVIMTVTTTVGVRRVDSIVIAVVVYVCVIIVAVPVTMTAVAIAATTGRSMLTTMARANVVSTIKPNAIVIFRVLVNGHARVVFIVFVRHPSFAVRAAFVPAESHVLANSLGARFASIQLLEDRWYTAYKLVACLAVMRAVGTEHLDANLDCLLGKPSNVARCVHVLDAVVAVGADAANTL